MKYRSTADKSAADHATVSAGAAIEQGLAEDGGLFLPESFPHMEPEDFAGLDSLASIAAKLLQPFFAGDSLQESLPSICAAALDVPAPLHWLEERERAVLELFHGPTAAFKDFGARFLARCLEQRNEGRSRPLTILVATSGDTGAAVAAAFQGVRNVEVRVLFPEGKVSPRQAHQLSCWGGNVRTFAVAGTFDDCQRLVKAAFQNPALRQRLRLGSANSINVGRLLPQMSYYAAASLDCWRTYGVAPGFVIPTGNLGNALACLWARRSGLPIGPVVLASNANRPVPDFLAGEDWRPRASVATLASAMDVGNPSNMERLRTQYNDEDLRRDLLAHSSDDDQIRARIRAEHARTGAIWCPHTATAFEAWEHVVSAEQRAARPWVLVATAHPAKFESIVEPLIKGPVPLPPALAELLERPAHAERIEADLDALLTRL